MKHLARREFRTRFRVTRQTLVVDLGKPRKVLSSATKGGGLVKARYILNHHVPANPIAAPRRKHKWPDPIRHLRQVAAQLRIDRDSVGLMTAVALRQLVTVREERNGLWVEGFVTVGVSNAVRAGEPLNARAVRSDRPVVGTINIILVTNARLTNSAMVAAVQVATESKTAVLLNQDVPSWTGTPGATGTGTDATVVACGGGPLIRYSGTHTDIGGMIGRLVYQAVTRGLSRSP